MERPLRVPPTAGIATKSWEKFGEIIVVESKQEMSTIANDLAFEHVQIMTSDEDFFLRTCKTPAHCSWAREPT
ncbi:histidinol dehydrogenase [Paraburkholderia fungorum]|uniref:histidinol dehydrogenase n=1 Tax=Paraburkholderia fungorum TaxID=134537 RepID=UPI00402B6835